MITGDNNSSLKLEYTDGILTKITKYEGRNTYEKTLTYDDEDKLTNIGVWVKV